MFLISQHKLADLPPIFVFLHCGFFLLLLLQVLVFVEFVAFAAGWVGAHALSWGRYVARLAAQS